MIIISNVTFSLCRILVSLRGQMMMSAVVVPMRMRLPLLLVAVGP